MSHIEAFQTAFGKINETDQQDQRDESIKAN
jgi:hypothetical protein